MPDEQLPDWIKRRQEQDIQRSAEAMNRALQRRNGELLIQKHAAEFCWNFLRSLEFNFRSLSALKINASLKPSSTPPRGPQIYSVNLRGTEEMNWKSFFATIQFQLLYDSAICCAGEGFHLSFALLPQPAGDGIGAALPEEPFGYLLTALQTAERLAKELANRINPE